eukprot:49916_1
MSMILLYGVYGCFAIVIPSVTFKLWQRDRKHHNALGTVKNSSLLTERFNQSLYILPQITYFCTIISSLSLTMIQFGSKYLSSSFCYGFKCFRTFHYQRPIILTFYQLIRFHMVSIHSSNKLPKKLMFSTLYVWGFLITILNTYCLYILHYKYDTDSLCVHIFDDVTSFLTFLGTALYLTWDWLILCLLYCK